jgi:hypothetical protein
MQASVPSTSIQRPAVRTPLRRQKTLKTSINSPNVNSAMG